MIFSQKVKAGDCHTADIGHDRNLKSPWRKFRSPPPNDVVKKLDDDSRQSDRCKSSRDRCFCEGKIAAIFLRESTELARKQGVLALGDLFEILENAKIAVFFPVN